VLPEPMPQNHDVLAYLLDPPAPKKGIITDLDDTLWSGIVGEVSPEHIAWDLASHRQSHGLYQKLLNALATEGVLVAVASKNDPAIVTRAFEREDLLIRPQQFFQLEVCWNAKSKAVERILETWIIGADSVIFVDDSPMKLAEVAAEHPGIQCLLFPRHGVTRRVEGESKARLPADARGQPAARAQAQVCDHPQIPTTRARCIRTWLWTWF
jgi:FkbH-like protein